METLDTGEFDKMISLVNLHRETNAFLTFYAGVKLLQNADAELIFFASCHEFRIPQAFIYIVFVEDRSVVGAER